jgi:hypothetical protein
VALEEWQGNERIKLTWVSGKRFRILIGICLESALGDAYGMEELLYSGS